ncbi:MAG: hypothetical protein ACTSV1_05070 [Alphaproteobacteria bacterium]
MPPEPDNEDTRAVTLAADALSLKEFDLFRLAHNRWFGHDATEKAIEAAFAAYMFHEQVPPWVRHLCRDVLTRQSLNRLDANELGADRYRPRDKVPRVGRLFLAIAAVLMLIVYLSILTTPLGPDDKACPNSVGNRFIEQWAYLLQGKPLPPCYTDR